MKFEREYPRVARSSGWSWTLRAMGRGDREGLLALARSIPEHDQLFLRRDITRPEVVDRWIAELEAGELVTVLAQRGAEIDGYATVQPDRDTWSPHVAELRVHVAPSQRGRGLGRILTQEAFALALSAGIEKMTARMTPDQSSALRTFEGLGFRVEGLLRDYVKDRTGRMHDLLVLSHDVARFHAMLDAFGVVDALGN
ncbi:MAG: GNAT family N-acetyltransferase [bacterium]